MFFLAQVQFPLTSFFFFFSVLIGFADFVFDHLEQFNSDITKAEIKEFFLQLLDRLEEYDHKRVSLITLDETAPVAEMKQMKFDHLPVYCWFLHKFLEKVGRNIEDQDFEEFLITDPEKLRNTHYQYTAVPPSWGPPRRISEDSCFLRFFFLI